MKKTILRISLLISLILLGFGGPTWLFAVGVFLYVIAYVGVEVIFLAAAVDAYFGYQQETLYVYTIATAILVFLVQWVKPRLSVYNQ